MSVVISQVQPIGIVLTQFQPLMAAVVVPTNKVQRVGEVVSLHKASARIFFVILPRFIGRLSIAIGILDERRHGTIPKTFLRGGFALATNDDSRCINAKPICIGSSQRWEAFTAAVYQPLFCAKIVQMLLGSFGAAFADPLAKSTANIASCTLPIRYFNACLLQKCQKLLFVHHLDV